MALIACARMYNVTPDAAEAWCRLLQWVNKQIDVPLDIVKFPAPAPLDALWRREDLGCVFMCGWPFSRTNPRPTIVAAPVPAAPRYRGRPMYFTDMVVMRRKGFQRIEDTFGGRLAWTTDDSHSGFNAPRFHLLSHRTAQRPVLYPHTVGPELTPMGALKSVLEDRADIAPLDSYALDLIRRHEPALVEEVEVIDTTAAASIPPLVASPAVEPKTVGAIRHALLDAGKDRRIREVLDALSLTGFCLPEVSDYQVIIERAAVASQTGYPYPG